MEDNNQNKVNAGRPVFVPSDEDVTVFAATNFRNRLRKFGIKRDDRRRHMYLLGKTGVGKSTVMENMIYEDIVRGEGVALVDPHGDFAEKILKFIPSYRVNDVVYFNPADLDYPVAFNPLESVDESQKHLVASGVVGVFKKMFAESWGPRLEYLLRNAILALLDYPGSTLLGIMRILVDKEYRAKVLLKVNDPVVKSFWLNEYAKYPDRFQVEAVSPIQNKVGQFLSNFLIRNIVGQVKSTIDMRDIMDNRKILIMNLAKGRIGEDTSAALGAMLITKIQLAAMQRVDIPEKERKDFYLYVDEFQNFATDSFATILSEARKYRLDLTIANQYIEQLEEKPRAAVFGNVGTFLCFRIGPADAKEVITEFEPTFTEQDLVNLKKYDTYLRLMIDGVTSPPFSASTLPPLRADQETNNLDKILKISRERYATPRDVVEKKISRWSGTSDDESGNQPERLEHPIRHTSAAGSAFSGFAAKAAAVAQKKPAGPVYKATCANCGKETEVSFVPDGVRPVYCKDCLSQARSLRAKGLLSEVPAPVAKPIVIPANNQTKIESATHPSEITPAVKSVPAEVSARTEGLGDVKTAGSKPNSRIKIVKEFSDETIPGQPLADLISQHQEQKKSSAVTPNPVKPAVQPVNNFDAKAKSLDPNQVVKFK